ncbi:DNA replication protein, partial [Streptococcus pyogenes]
MAQRRMFSRKITETDRFLEMPLSSQALYFHLNMGADDEGFIDKAKTIQRTIGASDDDMKLLIAKGFLIPFDSGVVVIRHWRIHNYIQSDRFQSTLYQSEKAQLEYDKSKTASLKPIGNCIQNVSEMETQVRLSKGSLDKDSLTTYPTVLDNEEEDIPYKEIISYL